MSQADSAIPDELLSSALFRDPTRARHELESIAARVPEEVLRVLAPLLSDSPDPDQALILLERLFRESGGEIVRLLDRHRALLHYAVLIFGHSYWLGETVVHHPELLEEVSRQKNLERSLGPEEYRERLARQRAQELAPDVSLFLAGFKRREYVRIALRDLLNIANLGATTEEISALAGVIIAEALRHAEAQMENRYGRLQCRDSQGRLAPARFAILALGKLGGNELNYSSDVDLLYLYSGEDAAGPLSTREYFVRQAQLLTGILSRVTTEGPAFRIDLRLRPQGSEGEPAIELRQALNYYAYAAQDWELQALIKARYTAGDETLAREFIRGVERQVYTENVNFEAIETALRSREKIGAQRRRLVAVSREPATLDVKLDRGGIRDIEFLVQCLQRVYGGRERWLRSSGTLFSLQKLHDKDHLSGKDFHELTVAYEFLRRVEHRLQLQRGRQLHRLPSAPAELNILHRAAGHGDRAESPASFVFAVQSRMARVAEIYERVMRRERRRRPPVRETAGAESAPSTRQAQGRPLSFDQVIERATAESPALGELVVHADLSLHARRALSRFLGSAMTSAERYAALLENPELVIKAGELLESSDYLTDILIQHPDALRVLEHLPAWAEAEPTETGDAAALFPGVASAHDLHEAMAALRRGFRSRMFARGAQDVLSPCPALDSMNETTRIADAAIRCALRLVEGRDEGALAVFALGRLGTHEFDIASDADLVFVRDPRTPDDRARAAAERLIHVLAAYTREGTIFAVDARLRPRGAEGELVVTPDQFAKYLSGEAQPWEALTYSKLRFVAGREDVAALILPDVRRCVVEMGADPGFPRQVLEMRARLERSNRYAHSFKLARGGFYDIDFIVSYLMLVRNLISDGNTLARLERLHENGLLSKRVFATLNRATILYRTADHVIRLVTGRARPELPQAEHVRAATVALVNRILGRDGGSDLQAELDAMREQVRAIFLDVVSG